MCCCCCLILDIAKYQVCSLSANDIPFLVDHKHFYIVVYFSKWTYTLNELAECGIVCILLECIKNMFFIKQFQDHVLFLFVLKNMFIINVCFELNSDAVYVALAWAYFCGTWISSHMTSKIKKGCVLFCALLNWYSGCFRRSPIESILNWIYKHRIGLVVLFIKKRN